MGRKPLPTADDEATKDALERTTRTQAMLEAPLQALTDRLEQERAENKQREQRIAQAFEVAGRIQALTFVEKVTTVGTLMQLKQIKETKTYRDLPNIGTWEMFCNYVGFSRQKVDEDLTNLAAFGQQFLQTVGSFSLGYREMKQLRQLTHDGSVVIDGECLTIEGESIPIDQDHIDELQAAIEQIIAAKNQLHKTATRLTQDMTSIVKEETKGLKIEKDALVQEVKRLKAFDPEAHDRDWSVAMMAEVYQASVSLESTIQKFIIDPRLVGDRPLQAQVEAHLRAAENQINDLRERFQDAFLTGE